MANEIYQKYSSGFDLDAYVFRKSDDFVYDVAGDAFELWVDGNVQVNLTIRGFDMMYDSTGDGIEDATGWILNGAGADGYVHQFYIFGPDGNPDDPCYTERPADGTWQ